MSPGHHDSDGFPSWDSWGGALLIVLNSFPYVCVVLFLMKIEFSFIQYILTTVCSLPQPLLYSRPTFKNKAGLPVKPIKHGIVRYNMTRQKTLISRLDQENKRRQRVPRAGKGIRDTPTLTIRSPMKHQVIYVYFNEWDMNLFNQYCQSQPPLCHCPDSRKFCSAC